MKGKAHPYTVIPQTRNRPASCFLTFLFLVLPLQWTSFALLLTFLTNYKHSSSVHMITQKHNRDRDWLTFLTVSSVFHLVYNSGRNVCTYGKLLLCHAKTTVWTAGASGQIVQENISALEQTKKRAL